ncbi:phospholipase [Ferrimonas sediminicola]|uniref:Phospholipase A1 n=1 Tax=Ferrimonas sediminicola TaxID=2569538 RepID=A0A4U1BD88_9GAMM|nr:phospholipase A [Ferrimonas sediminicola]TKB49049.1 phospholipase [Ferrimonas sediminicola]
MLTLLMLAAAPQMTEMDSCLLKALKQAGAGVTVAELRTLCQETLTPTRELHDTALDHRIAEEQISHASDFSLTAHRNNYMLPFSYNHTPNQAPFDPDELPLQRAEMKFQFSFKLPLTVPLLDERGRLFFAYTNKSWWQAFNTDHSAPFRETNHEPELFWVQRVDWRLGEWQLPLWAVGINHQSNGQNGAKSRSWNRIIGSLVLERGDWTVLARAWYRLPEESKHSPEDTQGDDNPDILDYLGYGEMGVVYKYHEHTFSGLLRNNLDLDDNRGAMELGWSFPLGNKVRGYVQYFYGYGESLIDYDVRSNRIGIGLEMTPLL